MISAMTLGAKELPIALAGAAWLAAFIGAHFAGKRARTTLASFAVTGPVLAVFLVGALVGLHQRVGQSDKAVFGAAIATYSTGVLAAVELLVRGKPRTPWILMLLADATIPVLVFFAAALVGSGSHG